MPFKHVSWITDEQKSFFQKRLRNVRFAYDLIHNISYSLMSHDSSPSHSEMRRCHTGENGSAHLSASDHEGGRPGKTKARRVHNGSSGMGKEHLRLAEAGLALEKFEYGVISSLTGTTAHYR